MQEHKKFNFDALETLVSLAGSPRKLAQDMYDYMGESGIVSTTSIRRYSIKKQHPGHEIVERFIAYAHRIGQQELEFYIIP
jgi:hypothetical protein